MKPDTCPTATLSCLALGTMVSTSAQGGTPANPVDIIGDMVLVLDHNLQLVWAWDSFAHEDINRAATLNDQAVPFIPAFTIANDWLHTNFAQGTADGNIILSQRSQDLVIKINYANGAGDGSVIWRMGAGVDFTLINPPTSRAAAPPTSFPGSPISTTRPSNSRRTQRRQGHDHDRLRRRKHPRRGVPRASKQPRHGPLRQ